MGLDSIRTFFMCLINPKEEVFEGRTPDGREIVYIRSCQGDYYVESLQKRYIFEPLQITGSPNATIPEEVEALTSVRRSIYLPEETIVGRAQSQAKTSSTSR